MGGMGSRLGSIQQVAFKCRVLLNAGEEGTLASPVRKFSFSFLYLPSKAHRNGHLCPSSAQLVGYEMVPSLGRFRPPVAFGGAQHFTFFCCNFVLREVWFLFPLQMLGDLKSSFNNNLLLDPKPPGSSCSLGVPTLLRVSSVCQLGFGTGWVCALSSSLWGPRQSPCSSF